MSAWIAGWRWENQSAMDSVHNLPASADFSLSPKPVLDVTNANSAPIREKRPQNAREVLNCANPLKIRASWITLTGDAHIGGLPRKVKMNKILATFVTTVAVGSAAFATGSKPAQGNMLANGKWSIRVFYGFNSGDIKDDADVDGIFGGGVEYTLPNMGSGEFGGKFHLGAEYNTSTEGTGNLKMDNWGIYGGLTFPIGQNTVNGLELLGNVGYYNTKLHASGASDDKWGFGFDAGVRYNFGKASAELFYRMRPEVNSVSNSAIVIGVNFPLGN